MTIGEKIKQARKEAGLTQKALGAKLGVSGSMIAMYETEQRIPKVETAIKIAGALNISFTDLAPDEMAQEWKMSDALIGVEAILDSLYKKFDTKEVSITADNNTTLSSVYFEVGTGEDTFVLHENDIEDLYNNIKNILPSWVELMKDTRPVEEIEAELLENLINKK